MQTRETEHRASGLKWLPWILLAVVGVLYLLSMDRWLSQQNLPALAQINGWDWKPLAERPVHFLLTYPIRFLPLSVQPLLLSGLTFLAAMASLAMLIRTVLILPQERTRLQRQRVLDNRGILPASIGWLPASLALLVCALQLTFWQNATSFSNEMLDLVLFAYVVRAVAEFRLDGKDGWLHKAALAYGFGIANSFSMIAYLPLFLLTVAWVKGRPFFAFQFLMKFALLGSVGLLAYLIVPLAHIGSDASWLSFWEALRTYLGTQKSAIFSYGRVYALFLGSVSLLPLLGFAFRWGESGGDISGASHQVTAWLMHIIHGLFLVLGCLVAFEYQMTGVGSTEVSVRQLAASAGTPVVLTVYYLSAISLGYYAGYFYLVFGTPSIHKWGRPSAFGKVVNQILVGVLILTLIAVPGLLVYRNLGGMFSSYSGHLSTYSKRLVERIPDGSITISDTPLWFYLSQAGASYQGRQTKLTHVDSGGLMLGAYHKAMQKKLPARWGALSRDFGSRTLLDRSTVLRFLSDLSRSNLVYYTEPSFGFFFEGNYLEPAGMVYRLLPLPPNRIEAPPLAREKIAAEDAFWRGMETSDFPSVIASIPKKASPSKDRFPKDTGAQILRTGYSRSLNWLGAKLFTEGQRDLADGYFEKALKLNPDNASAMINRAYLAHSRTNTQSQMAPSPEVLEKLKIYGGLQMLLRAAGPVIETGNMLLLARAFAEGQNLIQSAQLLQAVAKRSQDPMEYEVAIAKLLVEARRPEMALRIISNVREKATGKYLTNVTNLMELVEIEAKSADRTDDLPRAEKLLKDTIASYPMEDMPFSTLVGIYIQRAAFEHRRGATNRSREFLAAARQTLERQIQTQPSNVNAWVNYGAAFMRIDQYSEAVPALTKALEMDKDNRPALLNRAICYLKLNDLTRSQQDYERVRLLSPDVPYQVLYGLGEVAFRAKRNKDAIEFYEQYLKKAPSSAEAEEIRNRLRQLK
jgi:tetratricopeptide (TPR) repeat protein